MDKGVLRVARIKVEVSIEIETLDGYPDADGDTLWSRLAMTEALFVEGREIDGMLPEDAAAYITESARSAVEELLDD